MTARDVASTIYSALGNGINRFGAQVQFCFAAATMREEGPIIGAFKGADSLRWVSTSHFGGLHPQLQQR